MQSLLYAGFSSFVFVTGYVAMLQASAREEQRRLNAELRATRTLLAETSRVGERVRISRELRDLVVVRAVESSTTTTRRSSSG